MTQHPPQVGIPAALADRGVRRIVPFAVALRQKFRGVEARQGLLLRGPAGWGEWAPFTEYEPQRAARWLAAAIEAACDGFPAGVRTSVEVNAILPAPDPELAASLARQGFTTFKCKVGGDADSDIRRVLEVAAAVAAVGVRGRFRLDANEGYSAEQAIAVGSALKAELGEGLDYLEQPCAEADELRAVRDAGIRVAADELLRNAPSLSPHELEVLGGQIRDSADVLILKVAPLGGVRRALGIAEAIGLPCVVSGAMDTSIGLAAGLELARALPDELLWGACGLGTGHLLAEDVTDPTLLPNMGRMAAPSGLEPDEALLNRRALAAADSMSMWSDRLGECLAVLP